MKLTEEGAKNHEDPRWDGGLVVGKTGLQTVYGVHKNNGLRRFVQCVTLDRNGTPMGTLAVVDIGDLATTQDEDESYQEDSVETRDYENDDADLAGHETEHVLLEKHRRM